MTQSTVCKTMRKTFILLGFFLSCQSLTAQIKWLTFEEAIALHKQEPRKLLVDIYTDWCGWCKKMDKDTYSITHISSYINSHFYPIKLNAEQKGDIQFDGKTFQYKTSGRRGVHEMAMALTNNKLSYPTTVFLDEQLRIIQPVPGYIKAPQMNAIIHFISENHYKNTAWETYRASFTGE